MDNQVALEKRVAVLEALAEGLLGKKPLPSNDAAALQTAPKKAKEPYQYKLSARSYRRLQGVHPDLIKIAEHAIKSTPYDFAISEGLRSADRQEKLVARGASQLKVSKHQVGLAIDIVIIIDKAANWEFEKYREIAAIFYKAAKDLKIEGLFWGGEWEKLRDGPHFQLNAYSPFREQL